MISPPKPPFLLLFCLLLPLTLSRTPTCARSFNFLTGQDILAPSATSSILAWADPSPYLFVYDSYSQKLKSVNIETGEANPFHQVDFSLSQLVFYPQGFMFTRNATAGGVLVKWNYFTSLAKEAEKFQTDFTGFSMSPFFPIYDQFSKDPQYYILLFDASKLEILYLNGSVQTTYSNDQAGFLTVCSFPERRLVITGDDIGRIRVWNLTDNNQLNNTLNFTQQHIQQVEFLVRGKNSRYFLSAENLEKKLRIWSIEDLNVTYMIPTSFGDYILGIKSISHSTAIIYGNGQTFDYVNIVTGKIIASPTIPINTTIISLEVLSNTADGNERVAVLCSDGKVRVFTLNPGSSTIKSTNFLFSPLFPQIKKINFAMTFKRRNVDNTATSYMAIVSNTSNNTVWFIDETKKTNVTSFLYPSPVRGLFMIMARYLSTFQDMILVWFGNSFRVYQIQDDLSIAQVYSWDAKVNITIQNLELLYEIGTYSYAYVTVIDQFNTTTILNSTGVNVTSFVEPAGIKFFCKQNYMTNFAYCLPNDTLKIVGTNTSSPFNAFSVYGLNSAKALTHPNMTSCFSKNIVGGGYYITTNASTTINWVWDGSYLSYYNSTNITSLIIEGNALYTIVNANTTDPYVYEGVPGLGIVNNYSVGVAPGKNGFMFQFLENYFYSINELELARYHLDCPMGTTQSNTLMGACFPNCNNSFISLSNSSCAKSCVDGTYPIPILDTYNNFTAMLCNQFNFSIPACSKGYSVFPYRPICSQCLPNYFLLATDVKNDSKLQNVCAGYGGDPRLAAPLGAVTDGTGVAKWCNQFIDHCFYCDWDPQHCLQCEWTFYRQLDGLCQNCTNNTLFHNGSANGTGFCYNCSVALPNCLICNGNSSNCTNCFDNYWFDERINLTCSTCSTPRYAKIGPKNGTGHCRNCSDVIDSCLDCTEFGERCILCEQSLYIDVDYNCTLCDQPNKYKNGTDTGTGLCEYCNYSLPHCLNCFGNNSYCSLCMNEFFFYTDHSCVDCTQPNFFHNGSTEGSGNCFDCYLSRPHCNWCNNNPNHCDLCFSDFWFDENNTCSNCSRDYFPNMFKNGSYNGSGHCLYCEDAIGHCNQCTDNATACTHCDQTYYITYEDYNCSTCTQNTTFKNGSDDGYHLCYPCRVAFNNCHICDYPNDKCLLCDEDYFLNEFYRCQPYSFRPEYTNTSFGNSSLNFTIENNRRRLHMSDPCDYNRSMWSLDARLHSYWVASMDFTLIDTITLGDIENVVKPLNITETPPNYTDPKWTFYGNSMHNSLVLTGITGGHYKAKYFCIYGNTFSDETKPGVFDFTFPEGSGDNGLLYINTDSAFDSSQVDKGIQTMTCALQRVLNLGDTNQISTEGRKYCQDHRANLTIGTKSNDTSNSTNSSNATGNNSNSTRLLQTAGFASSDTGSLMTYVFNVDKNPVWVVDPSVQLIVNSLALPDFNQNLTEYLQAFDPTILYPNPISGEYVSTSGMLNMNVSYPVVTASFNTTTKTAGVLTLTVTQSDGFLYLGIQKNSTYKDDPTVDQLKAGMTSNGLNMDFSSTMLVKQNQKIKLTLGKMNPNLFYYMFSAGRNIYGTNTSTISVFKFATDAKNIIEKKTTTETEVDATPIIIGVVVGVVGLIVLIVVIVCIIRCIALRRENKSENESESQEQKEKKKKDKDKEKGEKYAPVISMENIQTVQSNTKETDPKAPTFETLPLTAIGASERKEH